MLDKVPFPCALLKCPHPKDAEHRPHGEIGRHTRLKISTTLGSSPSEGTISNKGERQMSIRTTGQKTSDFNTGLDHLRSFPLQSFDRSYNYALLMEEEDGGHTLYERVGMPCWGALREYEKGTRPDDPWPGDLRTERHLFPATGKPVAVAAFFNVRILLPDVKRVGPDYLYSNINPEYWNKFVEFIFNPELSPWKAACKDVELIKNEQGYYQGCVFKDTKIDPNVMVGLLRCNVNFGSKAHNWGKILDDNPDIDPRVAWLMAFKGDAYYFSPRVILDKFFKGEPVDISAGGTFYERESYNRPDIQFLFGGKNNAGELISSMSTEKLMEALHRVTA